MADNQFNDSVKQLLDGLDGFVSSKTVVGDPIEVNGSLVLPLMDVTLGVGAGHTKGSKNGMGGGLGAKMTPSAVLLIQKDGKARLINLKNQDTVSKIIDMIPDVMDKLAGKKPYDSEVEETIDGIRKNENE